MSNAATIVLKQIKIILDNFIINWASDRAKTFLKCAMDLIRINLENKKRVDVITNM